MEFSQLIEYNMSNIFLKNDTQNVVVKLFPDSFLTNEHISGLKLSKYIETKQQTTCFYLI